MTDFLSENRVTITTSSRGVDCTSIYVCMRVLLANHKLKDGVTCRNYGFPFPSKIQILFPFPRTSREIKAKLIRVNCNSLNQYSLPVHVNTYRHGGYNLQRFYNGRFAPASKLALQCLQNSPIHIQNSSIVHSKRFRSCSRNTVVNKHFSCVSKCCIHFAVLYSSTSYTGIHVWSNCKVILGSPAWEHLTPSAVLYKSISYVAQFCYIQCTLHYQWADYPVCGLSVNGSKLFMNHDEDGQQ